MTNSPDYSPMRYPDRFFIGGKWVKPSSNAMIKVIAPATEEVGFQVAEAREADVAAAVTAARKAPRRMPCVQP